VCTRAPEVASGQNPDHAHKALGVSAGESGGSEAPDKLKNESLVRFGRQAAGGLSRLCCRCRETHENGPWRHQRLDNHILATVADHVGSERTPAALAAAKARERSWQSRIPPAP
jgi:hypothetical protein